ncbi:MAG: hypothetical protein ABGX07_14860 [Pirellulaceae bacterium]|nr:hypothetical protein [Planctomycetaceae bacterium]
MTSSESKEQGVVVDRGALSALLREINATHLFVWSANAGGTLSSITIPVSDVAQQVRTASRILESNLDDAMKMIQSAANQFDNVTRRWDSQVRQSEQKLRTKSGAGRLNEAKSKHTTIRTRIAPVQSLFRRAAQSLNDLSIKLQEQEKRLAENADDE